MSTSKAISPPIGSEISALIRAPREGSSSSRDTDEILSGRGMLVATESFRVGTEIFKRGKTRVTPSYWAARRYPESFAPACADDPDPEVRRFRRRGGSTRVAGPATESGIFGLDFGTVDARQRKDEKMFGLVD